MAKNPARTVPEYLASLPPDTRKEIEAVRKVVKRNLPKGFQEGMDYGLIGYFVPLSRFPETHNGHPLCYAALGAQKNYNAVYLMNVYGDGAIAKQFKEAFRKAGKKLDMGMSCVRFKAADDLALDAVGDVIASTSLDAYVDMYEKTRSQTKAGKARAARKTAKKAVARKKPTAKKAVRT
jgi:hypothetical protein